MTIIVFLLDTSASMNQRIFAGGGLTLLDVAKNAVETFVKVRQKSMDSRGDRYMLLTFEEFPNNIKAGWKENLGTFMTELKNIQANGLTTMSQALRQAFDFLNMNRIQHGIDTYGQGRCPFYLEPSIILTITDGGRLSSKSGVHDELKLTGSSPGSELTKEPFRWDQRLFGLVLRMSGQPILAEKEAGLVPSDWSAIDPMCEVTGGRSYSITSQKMLHQCIDSLVQKVQAGVVIHFEKTGPDPPSLSYSNDCKFEESEAEDKNGFKASWQDCRKMIYVPRTNQKGGFAGGFWPIPESFWPDPGLPTLPARLAHPNVKFTCDSHELLEFKNFPFDKYELEPSPLTQFILARKLPNVCWQVYIPSSSRSSPLGHPFGYLKASSNLSCVNLFVMPYNYPPLLQLLDDLFRIHRLKPTNEWKAQFGLYLSTMPPYYAGPLKRALVRIGATVAAQMVLEENYLSYSVLNYLKKIKNQAKLEYDKTCNDIGVKATNNKIAFETKRSIISYKNPFDVPRHLLLDQLTKLRSLLYRQIPSTLIQQESLHSMPVCQMSNYQDYLKRMPSPLREIESTPVRQHMFGNPFKIDKRLMIDEADIDLVNPGAGRNNMKKDLTTNGQQPIPIAAFKNKRKPGPLPKTFVYRSRGNSPCPTPKREVEDYDQNLIINPIDNLGGSLDDLSNIPTKVPRISLPEPEETFEAENQDKIQPDLLLDSGLESNLSPASNFSINKEQPETPEDSSINHSILEPSKSDGENSSPELKIESIDPKYGTYLSISEAGKENADVVNRNINLQPEQPKTNGHKMLNSLEKLHNSDKKNCNGFQDTELIEILDEKRVFRTNLNVRIELYKEIRRPQVRMDFVLSQLSSIVGSSETRQKFLKNLKKEALKFKRRRLADLVDKHLVATSTSS